MGWPKGKKRLPHQRGPGGQRKPGPNRSYLSNLLYTQGKEALAKELRRLLVEANGSPMKAAEIALVSRCFFWHMIRRAGISAEPTEMRQRIKQAHRLSKVSKEHARTCAV